MGNTTKEYSPQEIKIEEQLYSLCPVSLGGGGLFLNRNNQKHTDSRVLAKIKKTT